MKLKGKFSLLDKTKTNNLIVVSIFALGAIVMLIFLLTKISLYGDDYLFGTFFRNGFIEYITQVFSQYTDMNGRWFVHMLIHMTLYFDTKLFIFVGPLILILTFIIAAGIQRKKDVTFGVTAVAIGILLVISLDLSYLRTSVLWISGFFNYIFPVFMTVLSSCFYVKSLEKQKFSLLCFILCFFTGATTEQGGVMVLSCLCILGLFFVVSRESKIRFSLMPIFFAILGFATVVLAPGTSGRIAVDSGGGLAAVLEPGVLLQRLMEMSLYFTGVDYAFWLMLIFGLTIGISVFINKTTPRICLIGFVFALLAVFMKFRTYEALTFFYLWYGFIILIAISFLFSRVNRFLGAILISGILSQIAMLATTTFGFRTVLPLLMTMVIVVAVLMGEIIAKIKLRYSVGILLVFSFIAIYNFLPIAHGYSSAKKIIDKNIEAVETSKEIHLSIDMDTNYGYTPMYSDLYFLYYYLMYYDWDSTSTLSLESKFLPEVYVNGEQATSPSYILNNKVYFPMISTLEKAGAVVTASHNVASIIYKGVTYQFSYDDTYIFNSAANDFLKYQGGFSYIDAQGENIPIDDSGMAFAISTTYLSAEDFEKIFGIKGKFNQKGNAYNITTTDN